jgi:hypothetical protein
MRSRQQTNAPVPTRQLSQKGKPVMPLVRLNLGEDTNNGPHARALSPPDTTLVIRLLLTICQTETTLSSQLDTVQHWIHYVSAMPPPFMDSAA